MAKSTLDAGWASLKTMLEYKSQQADIVYREINGGAYHANVLRVWLPVGATGSE